MKCTCNANGSIYKTYSLIWRLIDKDDDLRGSHEFFNTEMSDFPKHFLLVEKFIKKLL